MLRDQRDRPDDADARRWFADGEQLITRWVVERDDDLTAPSRLPDWTRAHVVAHLIGNAAGLGHLVTWAATGHETPMYASQEARTAQIDADATRSPSWLRRRVAEQSAELQAAFAALTPEQLRATVRTAQGRDRDGAEVAWLRARESYVHVIDLDVGYGFDDLPADYVDALLDDATTLVSQRHGAPDVRLVATDRDREWTIGSGEPTQMVSASAAELLAWALGRSASSESWPALPRWL